MSQYINQYARRDRCSSGHLYSPENTRIRMKDGRPSRVCLACLKAAWKKQNRACPSYGKPRHCDRLRARRFCENGHLFSEANTRLRLRKYFSKRLQHWTVKDTRDCRACEAETGRLRRQLSREARP